MKYLSFKKKLFMVGCLISSGTFVSFASPDVPITTNNTAESQMIEANLPKNNKTTLEYINDLKDLIDTQQKSLEKLHKQNKRLYDIRNKVEEDCKNHLEKVLSEDKFKKITAAPNFKKTLKHKYVIAHNRSLRKKAGEFNQQNNALLTQMTILKNKINELTDLDAKAKQSINNLTQGMEEKINKQSSSLLDISLEDINNSVNESAFTQGSNDSHVINFDDEDFDDVSVEG